jgi:hypothetical protein
MLSPSELDRLANEWQLEFELERRRSDQSKGENDAPGSRYVNRTSFRECYPIIKASANVV